MDGIELGLIGSYAGIIPAFACFKSADFSGSKCKGGFGVLGRCGRRPAGPLLGPASVDGPVIVVIGD